MIYHFVREKHKEEESRAGPVLFISFLKTIWWWSDHKVGESDGKKCPTFFISLHLVKTYNYLFFKSGKMYLRFYTCRAYV